MDQTIMISQQVETHGVGTFPQPRVLQHVRYFAQVKPAWGDLSSDFGLIADLIRIRVDISKRPSAMARDNATEFRSLIVLRPSAFFRLYHPLRQLPLRISRAFWGTSSQVTFSLTRPHLPG